MHYLYSHGKHKSKIPDVAALKERIVTPWQRHFDSPAEYDTTLLFVGISPSLSVMGQIGDGLILSKRVNEPGKFEIFHQPPKEYLNKPDSTLAQTDAINSLHVSEQILTASDHYSAFLLMTDGIADDLSEPTRYASDLVTKLWDTSSLEWNATLNKHLTDWPTPGHYDDKTLLVLSSNVGQPKNSDEATANNSRDATETMPVAAKGNDSRTPPSAEDVNVGTESR